MMLRHCIVAAILACCPAVSHCQVYQVSQPTAQSTAQPASEPIPRPAPREPRLLTSGGFPSLGSSQQQSPDQSGTDTEKSSYATPMVTTCSALAVVLGLFAALVWVSRKYGAKTLSGTLPSELVEVLGTSTIDARTQIMMLRVGSKIVVTTRGQNGLQALSEITDPDEVQHMTALCTGTAKQTFNSTLQDFQKETASGFAEAAPVKRSSRLFATA